MKVKIILIIHSKSTEKYTKDFDGNKMLVIHPPTKDVLKLKNTEEKVIAIGGGSVIDTAKIISKNRVIAIPTTFSGASMTSHSVVWAKKKIDIPTAKPITLLKPEYIKLNKNLEYTKADCLSHIFEAFNSRKSTPYSDFLVSVAFNLLKKNDWLNASLIAGCLIEIVGTNIAHALSYPMTLNGIPHGKALAYLLPKIFPSSNLYLKINDFKLNIDVDKIIDEALTYQKIYNARRKINKDILKRLL